MVAGAAGLCLCLCLGLGLGLCLCLGAAQGIDGAAGDGASVQ